MFVGWGERAALLVGGSVLLVGGATASSESEPVLKAPGTFDIFVNVVAAFRYAFSLPSCNLGFRTSSQQIALRCVNAIAWLSLRDASL